MAKKKSKAKNPSNASYKSENRAAKNKALKLERHKKEHPNDRQEFGARVDYTRKKPINNLFERVQRSIQTSKQQTRHNRFSKAS